MHNLNSSKRDLIADTIVLSIAAIFIATFTALTITSTIAIAAGTVI